MPAKFNGFPRETMKFLRELSANNNRAWFAENKPRYERHVVEPAMAFIEAMEPGLASVSKRFMALTGRSGGSLMRVYRDTRFGGDKTPYKTNIGIQFRHELGKDVHAPGFYFHVSPGVPEKPGDGCFLGAGLWRPEPAALPRIRQRIDDQPDEWQAVRDDRAMKRSWTFDGDSLKRAPKGFPADHPLIEDIKRTDFIVIHTMSEAEIGRPDLVKNVTARFATAAPLMRFLCKAVGVPF